MLILFGKIAKPVLQRLDMVVKYEDDFLFEFLLKSGDHLPGERDMHLHLFGTLGIGLDSH